MLRPKLFSFDQPRNTFLGLSDQKLLSGEQLSGGQLSGGQLSGGRLSSGQLWGGQMSVLCEQLCVLAVSSCRVAEMEKVSKWQSEQKKGEQ